MRLQDIPSDLLKPATDKKSAKHQAPLTGHPGSMDGFEFTGPVPHLPDDPNVLLYHGEPLLTWLPVRGRKLLAIACEEGNPAGAQMLVCELSVEQAFQLLDRQLKLRDVVYGAKAWFDMPDYYATPPKLVRREALPDDLPPMDGYLP